MKFAAVLLVVFATVELSNLAPAFARGGAANLMSSPGYQRRLQESRQDYQRAYTTPPAVYPGRKWRHRVWRRHGH
ncbi:hypothetical protein [Afipia clevelandensis]|nr:hypothetical protein [Afipia clevelandensis]